MAHSTAFPKLLIFGSQILSFDADSARRLRDRLVDGHSLAWAASVIRELPRLWKTVSQAVPTLQSLPGEDLLGNLDAWLRTGLFPEAVYPLPNILLTPLVVLFHLAQYQQSVELGIHGHSSGDDDLPQSCRRSTEALGLCTGLLSAAAVASSSSGAELQHYAAVAVRLAMVIGAVVDAKNRSQRQARSFSVSWSSQPLANRMSEILGRHPDAYISVLQDHARATVTVSGDQLGPLQAALEEAGFSVTSVPLLGRFHCPDHHEEVQLLAKLCDTCPWFQFPDTSQLAFPLRFDAEGHFVTNGKLHHLILHSMLAAQSDWASAFARVQDAVSSNEQLQVLCFGPENCVPVSLIRKLGQRFTHLADLNVAQSSLFVRLSGLDGPPEYRSRVLDNGVAVIGMACQLPGAADLDEFWSILCAGRSQHTEVPQERFQFDTAFRDIEPSRKWYGNFVQDHDAFDHKFFKKSPREMSSTDPQHRLMLQVAYQAVEQSGYFNRPHRDAVDKHIGCYIGVGLVDYERNIACAPANAYSATGNLKSFAAGKISHYFGWTGPSLTVDTACSSSAVAVHMACRAILSGECTGGALAGGVNVMTSPEWFQNLAGASFLSPTGQCKPFDAKGDGYCRAEGVGAVFLKKLSSAIADGDQIFGVIASSTVYQNQNCTPITVPNAPSLADLFSKAVTDAGLRPGDITYVEAHGTGTPVGDPAEYAGIRRVLGGPSRSVTLSLGSVKGLVGHTESASGIAALLKTLVMINKGAIPPQASFETINPAIETAPEDRITISTVLEPWNVDFRAALINNYGASGSNACLVVTQGHKVNWKPRALSEGETQTRMKYPFWFCGNDEKSLRAYCARFRQFLASQQLGAAGRATALLPTLSFQLSRQSNRSLPSSLIFNCTSVEDLQDKLAAFEQGTSQESAGRPAGNLQPAVVLCFGGQNSTCVGIDRAIYDQVSVFRSHLDACDAMCRSLGLESIYPDIFQRTPASDVVKLQTMLFATQYACARSWIDCGLEPAAVVGFSFGELTALCVAGVLNLETAIGMVAGRARVIQEKWGRDPGAMIAIEAEQSQVEELLSDAAAAGSSEDRATIACFNGPTSFTLAGSTRAIGSVTETLESKAAFRGVRWKRIDVTNAFHCSLVDPLVPDLERIGMGLRFEAPKIPVEHATETELSFDRLDSRFVANHMRQPVYFSHAARRLAKKYQACVWLEAGSNSSVTSIAYRAIGGNASSKNSHKFQSFNITADNSLDFLAEATVQLWNWGVDVTFWPHHASQRAQYPPLMLPPYQFEKSRHWIELKPPPKANSELAVPPATVAARPVGLWSFVGQDQGKHRRCVRFRVHTTSAEFEEHVSGHIIAQAAPLCPSTLQLHIAIDALMSVRVDASLQPRLRGMTSHTPLPLGLQDPVWLDAEAQDPDLRIWTWKMSSSVHSSASNGPHTLYVSGTIVFLAPDDADWRDEFSRFERLVGWERCERLLNDLDPDEVIKGPKIYNRFAEIVQYGDLYKGVLKLVGKGDESAGRVVARKTSTTTSNSSSKSWLDTGLADSFCQVAGIFVNTMTDRSPSDIYISDRIDQWVRSPAGVDNMNPTERTEWEVLALHHRQSEKEYVSDVFIYDQRTSRLAEVILGIHYRRVPKAALAKAISKCLPPTAEPIPPASTNGQTKLPNGCTPHDRRENEREKKKKSESGVSVRVRDIIVNLSGLEPEQITNDADLVELGIDSLMGMELAREIESAFEIVLSTDELMALTDFRSLVTCVQKHAALPDTDEEPEESDKMAEGLGNGSHERVEITQPNGVKQVNGSAVPNHLFGNTVLEVFAECKQATDDFIRDHKMGDYVDKVMPRSTELCVAHIVDAFEELGCKIRSAKPGQKLDRIQHLPRHRQFVDWMYELLEKEARLVDLDGPDIIRTAVSLPSRPAETLWQDLTRNFPDHVYDHNLTYLVGRKLADCLIGRMDGLQLIFGTPEGREIVSGMYGKSPINLVWVKQMEHFLKQLLGRVHLPPGGEPIRILEMGAGTGGTTAKMLPLLAGLGVPVRYTVTDLSSSLVAAARKRFSKEYPFVDFRTFDIEKPPTGDLVHSQHIVLATNCVHATHSLVQSTANIHNVLRPDGFLMMLEMTTPVPWVDLTFGLIEGWWLFDDGRRHALASPDLWETTLRSVGYGYVDWTEGRLPESEVQRIIIAMASGPRYDRPSRPSAPESDPGSMRPHTQDLAADIATRQAIVDAFVEQYTRDFQFPPALDEQSQHLGVLEQEEDRRATILVTGATGSLGSHLVAHLATLPSVKEVICLNRRSTTNNNDPTARQHQAMRSRGISLSAEALAKLRVLAADTSKPKLGLPDDEHNLLKRTVTHIVHNAWPMSITRGIHAFASQFQTMANLIALAAAAAAAAAASSSPARRRPRAITFQFISSIATVGCYASQPSGQACPTRVPEERMSVSSVLPTGYGDAKLVCERMLDATLHKYPDRFRAMVVRIAQIAGSAVSGYWNPVEHFAFVVKSAQTLRALPGLTGTLSWCPVTDVATVLGELMLSGDDREVFPIYHIENPSRQPWEDMIRVLADALNVPRENIVSFDEWLRRVRRFPGSIETDNPAGRLVDFLEHHFVRMSCGNLVLDTAHSTAHSATLRQRGPVSPDLVRKYVRAWKEMGFLHS
ncbi:polyketide synthase [Thermothielavioides terrestris NRRL 8126]|uniref:Polyketide synthase n=1 Tax=Thermothielavioides terrestris (strain ATCC 38088 / NRRL 8126) TaxID=578455 RepID=G2R8I4_THETT|nr:polyketide synthase [Thermothielavioides terrestris NRRL 8126]AEO67399.1 polyketide synthase [Thermothielavioides terrestris NRRL 8126]